MIVISLGGSIVAPDDVDVELIVGFRSVLDEHIRETNERAIVVVGGGAPARRYQTAYRAVSDRDDARSDRGAGVDAQDWIGVMATRLNAELLRHSFAPLCLDPVVYDPTGPIDFTGSMLVAAGWKPGFSTDYDAVMLAERFDADTIINLSNISRVYTADPAAHPEATPLERVGWEEFHAIVGTTWAPGSNLPFDPIATKRAREQGLRVIAAGGRDLANTRAILRGDAFVGTTIGPAE